MVNAIHLLGAPENREKVQSQHVSSSSDIQMCKFTMYSINYILVLLVKVVCVAADVGRRGGGVAKHLRT